MARTKVLLPVPLSPATSTRSPLLMTISVSPTTAVPSSSATEKLISFIAASSVSPRAMRLKPSPVSAFSSASSDTISEAIRRADAFQSASRG